MDVIHSKQPCDGDNHSGKANRSQMGGTDADAASTDCSAAVATDKMLTLTKTKQSPKQHIAATSQPQLQQGGHHSSDRLNRRNLSLGEWRRGTKHAKGHGGLVHVTVPKGRHWSVHGHTHAGSTVLLPEEALFLMECGALEVTSSGRVLSLQEAFQCFLSSLQLHFYQVYASLKRIGFIAHRVCLSSRHSCGPLMEQHSADLVSSPACPLCSHQSTKSYYYPDTGQSVMEVLEVYKPCGSNKSSPYRKSQPGPPHFRVLIARKDDEFPSGEEVRRLLQQQPLASVNVCIVDGSNLTYYSLETP